jgi:hypothetical protein
VEFSLACPIVSYTVEKIGRYQCTIIFEPSGGGLRAYGPRKGSGFGLRPDAALLVIAMEFSGTRNDLMPSHHHAYNVHTYSLPNYSTYIDNLGTWLVYTKTYSSNLDMAGGASDRMNCSSTKKLLRTCLGHILDMQADMMAQRAMRCDLLVGKTVILLAYEYLDVLQPSPGYSLQSTSCR